MWSMLFALPIQPRVWLVCFEHPVTKKYVRVKGGPYSGYKDCFAQMATLRGQTIQGVELK